MEKYDSSLKEFKHKILVEVIHSYMEGNVFLDSFDIAKKLVPGKKPTMRCCVYKEREIVLQRIRLILGGNKTSKCVVEAIPVACDQCPVGGYMVSDRCRGCIAKSCQQACKRNSISIKEGLYGRSAFIDKSLCVNCGMCAKACQYEAIVNIERPCEKGCPVKAIKPGEDLEATIDENLCIGCGKCVRNCPFGAIVDKSEITKFLDILKQSDSYPKVVGIIAPSIASQFKSASYPKLINGLYKLGFTDIIEAALGADLVALKEAKELSEREVLTTSCCPAFVSYIKKMFPTIENKISTTLSPMNEIGKMVKEKYPNAKIIFIGPCIAKKAEIKNNDLPHYIDIVLTFEELDALFDGFNIKLNELPEKNLETSGSFFGRGFALAGGVSKAVRQALYELGINFDLKEKHVDGLENIKAELLKLRTNRQDFNLLEGMMCEGGCAFGPSCITEEIRNKSLQIKYSEDSKTPKITDNTSTFNKK